MLGKVMGALSMPFLVALIIGYGSCREERKIEPKEEWCRSESRHNGVVHQNCGYETESDCLIAPESNRSGAYGQVRMLCMQGKLKGDICEHKTECARKEK